MNNIYDDFSILTDFGNLYDANRICRRGKLWKESVSLYDMRSLESTVYLQYLLKTGKYLMDPYHSFEINERGKTRSIKSVKYKDRIVQKCLCENIIRPTVEPMLVNDNGASTPGKGTQFAVERLKEHIVRHVRKYGSDGYVAICDAKGYFDSIDHEYMNGLYRKAYSDESLVNLIEYIHSTIPGEKGVPLGNELSQIDALLALSKMDHFVKEQLRIKGYGRYMDDFYMIHHSKEYLLMCIEKVEVIAAEAGVTLNKNKTKIVSLRQGFTYLGYRIYVTDTGKVVVKVKTKKKVNQRHKLKKQKGLVEEGRMTYAQVKESYTAWKAPLKYGNSHYMLQEMDCYFYDLFKEYLDPYERNEYIKLLKYREERVSKRKNKIKKNKEVKTNGKST